MWLRMTKFNVCVHSFQKLDNRKSALERTNALSDELKQKWRHVLYPVFSQVKKVVKKKLMVTQSSFYLSNPFHGGMRK